MKALREKMPTPGGLSVRREIEIRLAEARTAAIEEVIGFLEAAGHAAAAADLRQAAFGPEVEKGNG